MNTYHGHGNGHNNPVYNAWVYKAWVHSIHGKIQYMLYCDIGVRELLLILRPQILSHSTTVC